MGEVKEEKVTRYRSKDGKFRPPIKEEPKQKPWYEELPQKKQSTTL